MPPFGPPTTATIFCENTNLSYWQNQALTEGTTVRGFEPGLIGFSRLTLQWTRATPVNTREDLMATHLDFVHTDISTAVPLSATEQGEVEAAMNTAYTGITNRLSTTLTLSAYVWHNFKPLNTRPGPAVRTTLKSVPGTNAGGRNADQLAVSATYITASRKHWGRSYWPFATSSATDGQYGRITSSHADAIATMINSVFSTPGAGNGITPCVASLAYKGIMTVQTIQVDDIWDVIRSRRAKTASYRKQFTGS